jgi:SAM-dependent methyltransferase
LRKKTPINFLDYNRVTPVSPIFGLDRGTPIDRYYIERFLESQSHLFKGRTLEIGDSTYSKRFGDGRVGAFEVLNVTSSNPETTIVGDLTDMATLPNEIIDCFICTQTFNFIFDVKKALVGAHHLLKPGGVMLATVAGISQISRFDMDRWGDYWRFTTASVYKLLEPIFSGEVEIVSFGNVLAATAFLQGVTVEDLPKVSLLDFHDPDYQMLIGIIARKGL